MVASRAASFANSLDRLPDPSYRLDGADFVVNPKERVGIVGKNGAGKSTLFALLRGELDPDAGTLELPSSWRIAAVEQEISDLDRPAREFVIDGDTHLRSVQAEREQTSDAQGQRIAELDLQGE